MNINFFTKIFFRSPVYSLTQIEPLLNDNNESNILNDKYILYSIYLSSPNLFFQIHESSINKKNLYPTLLKYVGRIGYRTLPFGGFSGMGLISSEYTKNKNLHIIINNVKIVSQLDYSTAYKLNNYFHNTKNENNTYSLNPSIIFTHGKYRYINFFIDENGNHNYDYTTFNSNHCVKKIFKEITNKKSLSSIINEISVIYDNNAVNELINEMIFDNILVSEFSPYTIGEYNNIYCDLIKKFDEYDVNDKIKLQYFFQKKLIRKNIITKNDNLLYVNTFFYTNNKLSKNQHLTIKKSIDILNNILIRFPPDDYPDINNFKKRFEKRFEGKTVSLLKALDPEKGINYLSNGYSFSEDIKSIDTFFLRRINRNLDNQTLFITENDWEKIVTLPITHSITNSPTGCARISLYTKNNTDFSYIRSISPHSPLRILTRFTNSNEEVHELCKEISDFEDSISGDVIFAEIDYLPNLNQGNLINRTVFRKHKIIIHSKNSSEYCIPINDLYLKINNEELILFSRKLKKQIIPCFSNALEIDKDSNPPIISFLFDYYHSQYNHTIGSLDFNKYHKFYKHIPRIMFNNIILKKETWQVSVNDFITNNINSAINSFDKNRARLNIPSFFEFSIGDIDTFIDSTKKEMVRFFLTELNKHKQLIISESLLQSFNSILLSKKKEELNNEFFIPFKNHNFRKKQNNYFFTYNKQKSQRYFIPNTEWIYYKIYINKSFYIKFLLMLKKKLASLFSKNIIHCFFYLTFSDPDFHIRLRLNINTDNYNFINNEISILIKKLYQENYIIDVSLNTYIREIERYGAENIKTIEEIFCVDSIISLDFIDHSNKTQTNTWIYSLKLSLTYINFVFTEIEDKIFFIKNMKEKLSSILTHSKHNTQWINEEYQKYFSEIKSCINDNSIINHQNKKKLELLINKLDTTHYTLPYYIENIIHMHVTRITCSENRLYELLIYSTLYKIINYDFHHLNRLQ